MIDERDLEAVGFVIVAFALLTLLVCWGLGAAVLVRFVWEAAG